MFAHAQRVRATLPGAFVVPVAAAPSGANAGSTELAHWPARVILFLILLLLGSWWSISNVRYCDHLSAGERPASTPKSAEGQTPDASQEGRALR